ncbi:MAG: hypothetical protein O7G87_20315 [bacterium]|nr:hypothetical protein [bacterium]
MSTESELDRQKDSETGKVQAEHKAALKRFKALVAETEELAAEAEELAKKQGIKV